MLDIKLIRENTDMVRQAILNRKDDPVLLDELLKVDAERRKKTTELEEQRRVHKESSRHKQQDNASLEEGRKRRDQMKALEDIVYQFDEQIKNILLQLPNIPQSTVPIGKCSDDNSILRTWGEPKKFDFTPAPALGPRRKVRHNRF